MSTYVGQQGSVPDIEAMLDQIDENGRKKVLLLARVSAMRMKLVVLASCCAKTNSNHNAHGSTWLIAFVLHCIRPWDHNFSMHSVCRVAIASWVRYVYIRVARKARIALNYPPTLFM